MLARLEWDVKERKKIRYQKTWDGKRNGLFGGDHFNSKGLYLVSCPNLGNETIAEVHRRKKNFEQIINASTIHLL